MMWRKRNTTKIVFNLWELPSSHFYYIIEGVSFVSYLFFAMSHFIFVCGLRGSFRLSFDIACGLAPLSSDLRPHPTHR